MPVAIKGHRQKHAASRDALAYICLKNARGRSSQFVTIKFNWAATNIVAVADNSHDIDAAIWHDEDHSAKSICIIFANCHSKFLSQKCLLCTYAGRSPCSLMPILPARANSVWSMYCNANAVETTTSFRII
jgi:hypothetical protein